MALEVPFDQQAQVTNSILKLQGLEDLNCTVYEISESQDFGLPQNPIDKNSFIADTIYKLPKRLTVRVLVSEENVSTFIQDINEIQFSDNLFTIVSTANEVFTNMKISNYAKDVTSQIVGKVFYNIGLEEAILVQSLTEAYTSTSNAGYSNNIQTGTKTTQKQPKSTIKGFL